MPYCPMIQKGSRGCCCLATRPKFGCVTAFCFSRGKTLLRAIQSGHRRFRRACEGHTAKGVASTYCTSAWKRLSAVIQWISRAFSMVDFQAGERQCVKRPAGFTADGRADRISSRFDRICSFFRAYRLEKAVCQARVYLRNRCVSHTQDSAKTGGFFACLRAFPVCQVYTQKNQYLCNQGGSVCIR